MAEHFTRPNIEKVVGKLGTTPEQRGLSTQEFKDKFDEMPEAIQQYIKETLLTELDAFKQEFMTHQADYAAHGATSEATASKIALRDANGRIKVNRPIGVSHVMNISDKVSGSYTTGQTEKSNITIGYNFKYLLFVWVSLDASTSQVGVYVINRRTSSPTANVFTVLSAASVTVSVDAELKVNVKNTSGSNRTIDFTLIGLGA